MFEFAEKYGYLTGRSDISYDIDKPDRLYERYEHWLRILLDHVKFNSYNIEFFNCSVLATKE